MAKTIEQKLVFSSPEGAKITKVSMKTADDGKSMEIIIISEVAEEHQHVQVNNEFDELFPIIDPRELIGHEILEYKPKTNLQKILRKDILKGIELKLPAFRAPSMAPSEEDGKIVFKPGNKPAVGHSADWWEETWMEFMPSKNSRSGTELHWAAFLGMLMKYLVEEKNYSIEDAWEAVCEDSRDLGHYWNSENTKHKLEPTGSRRVGNFFDLANTCRILKKWEGSGFWMTGGVYVNDSNVRPLSILVPIDSPFSVFNFSVGWPVLDV